MKIIEEKKSLSDLNFWGGAQDNAAMLSYAEMEKVDGLLEAEFPDGITDIELNDLFWFSFDYICQLLGYEDEESLMNQSKESKI